MQFRISQNVLFRSPAPEFSVPPEIHFLPNPYRPLPYMLIPDLLERRYCETLCKELQKQETGN